MVQNVVYLHFKPSERFQRLYWDSLMALQIYTKSNGYGFEVKPLNQSTFCQELLRVKCGFTGFIFLCLQQWLLACLRNRDNVMHSCCYPVAAKRAGKAFIKGNIFKVNQNMHAWVNCRLTFHSLFAVSLNPTGKTCRDQSHFLNYRRLWDIMDITTKKKKRNYKTGRLLQLGESSGRGFSDKGGRSSSG